MATIGLRTITQEVDRAVYGIRVPENIPPGRNLYRAREVASRKIFPEQLAGVGALGQPVDRGFWQTGAQAPTFLEVGAVVGGLSGRNVLPSLEKPAEPSPPEIAEIVNATEAMNYGVNGAMYWVEPRYQPYRPEYAEYMSGRFAQLLKLRSPTYLTAEQFVHKVWVAINFARSVVGTPKSVVISVDDPGNAYGLPFLESTIPDTLSSMIRTTLTE